MSRRQDYRMARELKHADSECYGEPVDVDALVRDGGGDAQPQEVAQEADEASQRNDQVKGPARQGRSLLTASSAPVSEAKGR